MDKIPGPSPDEFIWATGIEDTFVPQTRPGHRALDEYALMGHYEHWREDLALARDLGLQAIRWGCPGTGSSRCRASLTGAGRTR